MIKEIIVTNANRDSLTMTLMRPEKSGLKIHSIDGLGPGKTNINVKEYSAISGSRFSNAKMPSRNIVLTLSFIPMPTIEATRLSTYKYFPIESRIRLDIVTDTRTYYIYGYVESNEPTIFSQYEGTTISILCPNPYFNIEDGLVTKNVTSSSDLFSFPFSASNAVDDLIFGEIFYQTSDIIITLDGTISIGPTIRLYANGGPVNNPEIYFYNPDNSATVQHLGFSFSENLPELEDGDYLTIICEKNNKSVIRYDSTNDEFINYIGAVTLDSAWPLLSSGENILSYEAASGEEYIRFYYEYTLKYAGV